MKENTASLFEQMWRVFVLNIHILETVAYFGHEIYKALIDNGTGSI